jgi:hypothetical protein
VLKERKKKKGETRENPRKAKQSKAQEKEGQMGKKPKSKAKAIIMRWTKSSSRRFIWP